MTPAGPGGGQRLVALDGLRGLAALCVVLYHTILRYPDFMAGRPSHVIPLAGDWLTLDGGRVPVLWFFLISGFVIAWTVDRCRTPMDFVVSRFSRLYPAYWASLVVIVLACWIWPLPEVVHTPLQVLANVTMLQEYALVPDVASVYWSLAVEIVFYVYVGVLFAAGLWRWAPGAACAWAMLSLAAAGLAAVGMPLPWRVGQVLLVQYAPLLVSGMALYQLWRGGRILPLVTLGVAGLAILAGFGVLSALLVAAGMAAIAAAVRGGMRWAAAPPLVWLGGVSYALYLVHELPSYIAIRTLDGAGVPHAVSVCAAIVLSIGGAALLTYGVERPALRLIRAAYRSGPALPVRVE